MTESVENQERIAIVLLSGGLDSATTLAIAQDEGFCCHTISFDYGQRHHYELKAAEAIASELNVTKHVVMKIDLRAIGGSALTDDIDVPEYRSQSEMESKIPVTYVPARNTVFLSMALAYAEVAGATDIFIGVNAVDYSGYPDCRPEFIISFEQTANLATRAGIEGDKYKIHTPLMKLGKEQIIQTGVKLGVDYSLTHSCYDPDSEGRACGRCDSCVIRARGFKDAGVPDPTSYAPMEAQP